MSSTFDVVYLTAAPATGKSTIAEILRQVITPIEVLYYGAELNLRNSLIWARARLVYDPAKHSQGQFWTSLGPGRFMGRMNDAFKFGHTRDLRGNSKGLFD